MKINFDKLSEKEFALLEDKAIDGQLDYDNFPAQEYRYFSRLAKLGYKNRHDGWSKEICEQKQREFRMEYLGERERENRFFKISCKLQENIRRGETTIWKIFKSETNEDKLKYALQAIELMTNETGLAKQNGIEERISVGCEYCMGITEWKEKLSAEGKEVTFNFCPICGRMIEKEKNDTNRP